MALRATLLIIFVVSTCWLHFCYTSHSMFLYALNYKSWAHTARNIFCLKKTSIFRPTYALHAQQRAPDTIPHTLCKHHTLTAGEREWICCLYLVEIWLCSAAIFHCAKADRHTATRAARNFIHGFMVVVSPNVVELPLNTLWRRAFWRFQVEKWKEIHELPQHYHHQQQQQRCDKRRLQIYMVIILHKIHNWFAHLYKIIRLVVMQAFEQT